MSSRPGWAEPDTAVRGQETARDRTGVVHGGVVLGGNTLPGMLLEDIEARVEQSRLGHEARPPCTVGIDHVCAEVREV